MRIISLLLLTVLLSCSSNESNLFKMDNLYAWCIVPFDNQNRSPQDRIELLKELGFKKYAYDWRQENIPEMCEEWNLAKATKLEVSAVWIWIDDKWDKVGALNNSNEQLLQNLKECNLSTQIWIGFHANFFDGLSDTTAIEKGAKMIDYLANRADSIDCKIGLYNHGDWFGEPENQIKILKKLPQHDLGLIYNFHHAHHHIERFGELTLKMIPYLWAVNLNGMQKEGPKILPIGKGDSEEQMMQILIQNGYDGSFGVLGHVEDADVKLILQENLAGLKKILND